MKSRKEHWEEIYRAKQPDEMSWFQETPALSLELISGLEISKDARIIDVGGGASRLIDGLLDAGYTRLSVLDLSAEALMHSKRRLGDKVSVRWIEADITTFEPPEAYDVWHDRAVFHFLTAAEDRKKYGEALRKGLMPGGRLIIAAFAPDGPEKCSGLSIQRYDAALLLSALGPGFSLLRQVSERHVTPWNAEQRFNYFLLQRD